MRADELAEDFYNKRLAGQWISAARTKYIFDLARNDNQVSNNLNGSPVAQGVFRTDDGASHFWSIVKSPINGAGVFQVTHGQTTDDRELEVDTIYQEYQDAMKNMHDALDSKLEDGTITQAQYDNAFKMMEQAYQRYHNNPSIGIMTIIVSILLLGALTLMGRKNAS